MWVFRNLDISVIKITFNNKWRIWLISLLHEWRLSDENRPEGNKPMSFTVHYCAEMHQFRRNKAIIVRHVLYFNNSFPNLKTNEVYVHKVQLRYDHLS